MKINKNDIFTPDITTANAHIVYPCVKMEKRDYTVIETFQDNSEKAMAFANEINGSVMGNFKKAVTRCATYPHFVMPMIKFMYPIMQVWILQKKTPTSKPPALHTHP